MANLAIPEILRGKRRSADFSLLEFQSRAALSSAGRHRGEESARSIETKEGLDKVPSNIRQCYEKLQQNDLPTVIPSDEEDDGNDSADLDDNGTQATSMEQLCRNFASCELERRMPSLH